MSKLELSETLEKLPDVVDRLEYIRPKQGIEPQSVTIQVNLAAARQVFHDAKAEILSLRKECDDLKKENQSLRNQRGIVPGC